MTNPSKRKGDKWERDVVGYLRGKDVQVSRQRQTGSADQGDLAGLRLWAIECKDDNSMSPRAMALQADTEARNAGKPFGVAVRKSPRAPIGEATVIMTLDMWLKLHAYMEANQERQTL